MKPNRLAVRETAWPFQQSKTETQLEETGLLNPASGPGWGFQSKLHALQSSTVFSTPYTLCGKQPFCTWGFAPLQTESASTNFKVLHEGEATSEACEYCFTTSLLKDGFLSLTQWDTVRRHFRSLSEHRAPRQSLLSTNWSSPLGFVYLNETLRPWGVCWGKVRNAKYLFLSSSSFVFTFFFSLIVLQLRDPKILGKHPGSAALLSQSPSKQPSPPTLFYFFILHWDLLFPAVSMTCNFLGDEIIFQVFIFSFF